MFLKSFNSSSDFTLLNDVNWTINPGKRIALIGPNGAGKTTLLRLVAREITLQSGEIIQPKEYKIGYLPQEEISFGRESVLIETLAGNKNLLKMESDITHLQNELLRRDLTTEEEKNLTEKLGVVEQQFSIHGGYTMEARAKKILTGLGFKESEMGEPIFTRN